ncbi:Uncharacterised protein [Mycobacterium tuberculosis]|uniref:Uncharacterized protein n=1 Tax=Mycobacterium tuberculosis TaxID=1773 RepID=A0A0T9ZGB4_MYCTX|nr:Uncharacterised protein [Mycobacterium tuberculosis]CFB88689.1 Uncharacterised protein [Mycobacterium tuberculosis]CFB92200.1 Uncharacterised protein [Mycobacterium tuberculosis]CFR43519.1 Uncharacterised protein [Mycobacterium tuberculosis]CFS03791.1 Uncharacterised protein [Mycobacterium tuberculosis]
MFAATSDINRLRLAATRDGGTVIANAVPNASAAALACVAVSFASAAVAASHPTYGVAAAAIAAAAGPIHGSTISVDTTDPYETAAEVNSAATPSQAAAAASIDSGPGPEYIRLEFTSGGKSPKSIASNLLNRSRPH